VWRPNTKGFDYFSAFGEALVDRRDMDALEAEIVASTG